MFVFFFCSFLAARRELSSLLFSPAPLAIDFMAAHIVPASMNPPPSLSLTLSLFHQDMETFEREAQEMAETASRITYSTSPEPK